MKHVLMVGGIAAVLSALAGAACAQPVLLTAPATVGPTQTSITPTGGGAAVALSTAQITVRGTTLTINGRHAIGSLHLEPGARLKHSPATTFDYSGNGTDIVYGVSLIVSGAVAVDGTAAIDVSGLGYPGSTGPGAGASGSGPCGGGGGGHGGHGGHANCSGVVGGPEVGIASKPTLFGSGGGGYPGVTPGGAGGGAVKLVVGDTITIDGAIIASGDAPVNASGGAGGSIWLTAPIIRGSGALIANGATEATTNDSSGGGGGGRIAITGYCSLASTLTTTVIGGDAPPLQRGTIGSVFTQGNGSSCCPADFNGDGALDFFDYDDFVTCFEGGACPPGNTADFNNDTAVDFFDYDDFVSAFEAGC